MIAALAATLTLGYRPFIDPLPLDPYWLMLLPVLVIAIAVVYKAIKVDDLSTMPRQAASLAIQILVFMVLAGAVLWVVTEMV